MKKKLSKNKIAFFMLVTPYIFLTLSWVLVLIPIDFLFYLGFLGSTLLFPMVCIFLTIPSIVLQIISLCKNQSKTKNIIMLLISVISILFACFYVKFIIDLGANV